MIITKIKGKNREEKKIQTENIKLKDKIIALSGNPNVGKSTVFNQLTGLKQHTGNWSGKTVTNAKGYCSYKGREYTIVDIPGCYSLMAHSAEEEVARDFICFEQPDAIVVVCDAVCLERNMNLVLQILEVSQKVIVCVNLIDEAQKKKIHINLSKLEKKLQVPVVATNARKKQGLEQILKNLDRILSCKEENRPFILYPDYIEKAIDLLEPVVREKCTQYKNIRWLCVKLLHMDQSLQKSINSYMGYSILEDSEIEDTFIQIKKILEQEQVNESNIKDVISSVFVKRAEEICKDVICYENEFYHKKDRILDQFFTSKFTGFPIMFFMIMFIFWITIIGANYPSQLLSHGLFLMEDYLVSFFVWIGTPTFLYELLVYGMYHVLAWVISVMLPPMMIFFPLFTLLEDFGYLPRVAYNLDHCFKKCRTCGKQALTMCMGFGCNAVGVTGCRIIDSKRERFIAIITNSFVPCNGKFPTIIAIISMFFISTTSGLFSSFLSALLLVSVIMLGTFMTFVISKILSSTILKGVPSSFTLELPPYRKPQIGKIIIRSVFDRALFILGRAIIVAAPAGLVIWLMANIMIGDKTLLLYCSQFLNPFAKLLGMDGVILLGFILGFPANEIVVPIIIMIYMSKGGLMQIDDLQVLKQVLVENGWTWITATSTILFSLMHWPCSTTCLTIKKETGSLKWTILSFLVPTITGISICFLFTTITHLFLY